MRWFRFSIAGLILFILICGVAFAALKESTDLWEHSVFSLTLLVLVTALLLAFHRTGARRAFWLGFALLGGWYLALSLIPPIETRLISSQGLSYIYSMLPGKSPKNYVFTVTSKGTGSPIQQTMTISSMPSGNQISPGGPVSTTSLTFGSGTLFTSWGSSPENFVKIGHSLLALFLAWLGGMLSRRLSRAPSVVDSPLPEATAVPS
jgi:hypothetical protein